MNRLMSSQRNNNKKSIDHLLFEKNTIFVFFHEEASIRGYTIKPHTLGYTDTNRIDSDRQLTEWKKKNFIYFFYIITFIHSFLQDNDVKVFMKFQKKRYAKYLSVMCLQGKERKWAEQNLKNLGLEKAARNCEESKLKQMFSSKENKIVSLLEL